MGLLLPVLENWPREKVFPLWKDALHRSADQTRGELLSEIAAFAPVISRLGGAEGIREAIQAIDTVARWLP